MIRHFASGGILVVGGESNGEPGRNRTFNQQIKSLLLCQLSYGPTKNGGVVQLEPWCARQGSNLRPTAPEAVALSS